MEALSNEAWIYDNLAGILGGGIYAAGDVTLTIVAKTSDTYHIDGNEADDNGGGIFATTGADLLLVGNISVDDNTADLSGGGFYLGSDVRARLLDSPGGRHIQIAGNTASSGNGGGIYSNGSSEVTIWGGVIGVLGASNQALGNLHNGGGIYAEGSFLSLKNTIIQYNYAEQNGGGIAAVYTTPVYIDASNVMPTLNPASFTAPSAVPIPCNPLLLAKDHYCSEIRGNSAGMLGGGIYLYDNPYAEIAHTAFIGNSSFIGSALDVYDTVADLEHCLVSDNTGPENYARAVEVFDSDSVNPPTTRLNALNNTFVNSTYEAIRYESGTEMYFLNNIIWGNGARGVFLGTEINVECNDTQDSVLPWAGNVSWDPLFATTWRGDYRLGVHSNAIDACAVYTSLDLDGIPRPQGSGNDMGSFEARWNYVLFVPVVVR